MALLRNAAGTKLLVNAAGDALKVPLRGAACPDPCEGCVGSDLANCELCFDLVLDSIEYSDFCYNTVRRVFMSGVNNNPILLRAYNENPPCLVWMLSEGGTVYGHYTVDLVGDMVEDAIIDRLTVYANFSQCLDGRIRVDNLDVWGARDGYNTWVWIFSFQPGTYLSDKYLGDPLPSQLYPCSQHEPYGYLFHGGTAVLTLNTSCSGYGEPTVVKATDCETGLSSINVNLDSRPTGSNIPYAPKNGDIIYRPGDKTSDPIDVGTTWVQESCESIIWPRCSRCDGSAGTVTYAPEGRPNGTNIFTVAAVDYYPDGETDTAAVSTGVWREGSCGGLKRAVRCSDTNIAGVPLAAQDLVPDVVSYDESLLSGGTPSDFSVLLQIVITWDGSDYCVNVPYQCTDDDADGSESYQAMFVQDYDCSELPFGQNQSGWSCDPSQGPVCSDCCGADNYPSCCQDRQYRLCTCCLGEDV